MLILIFLGAQLLYGETFIHQAGKTEQVVIDRPGSLVFSRGRESIAIDKNSCSLAEVEAFWKALSSLQRGGYKKAGKKNWSSLSLGGRKRYLTPWSKANRKLLGLRKSFLVLKTKVRPCKRNVASEITRPPSGETPDLSPVTQRVAAVRKCVETICPDPTVGTRHSQEVADKMDLVKDIYYQQNIKTLLNRDGTRRTRAYIANLSALLKWLENGEGAAASARQSRYLNLIGHLAELDKFEWSGEDPLNPFDDQKSKAKFPGITDEDYQLKKNAALFLLKIFNKEFSVTQQFPYTDRTTLQVQYSPLQILQLLVKVRTEKLQLIQRVRLRPENRALLELSFFSNMANVEKVDRIIESGVYSSEDLADINSDIFNLEILDFSAKEHPLTKGLEKPFKKSQLSNNPKLIPYLRGEIQKSQQELKSVYGANTYNSPTCDTAYTLGQAALPTDAQLSRWNSKKDGLKEKFLKGTEALLSESTHSAFKKHFGMLYLVPPMTKNAHRAHIIERLKKVVASGKRDEENIKLLKSSPHKNYLLSLLGQIATLSLDDSDSDALSDEEGLVQMQKACKALIPKLIAEITLTTIGEIIVGPMTVTRDPLGDGFAYHEMAHSLHNFLEPGVASEDSQSWKSETLSCISSIHGSNGENFQNEDFADIIPVIVDKSLGNPECISVGGGRSDAEYQRFRLRTASGEGPHSTDFFRLLHVEMARKNELPPACYEAIGQKSTSSKFKRCGVK